MTTWNSAFEAIPDDDDDHSLGAGVIRTLKSAIRERVALEHNFEAGTQPFHKRGECSVVFIGTTAQINALTPPDGGIAWNTDLSATQVYKAGVGWLRMNVFGSGVVMLFVMAAAPVGWVQDLTWNDRIIRVVDGTGTGATTGGTWTLSGISVDGHTLTIDEIPEHNHALTHNMGVSAGPFNSPGTIGTAVDTYKQGGGQDHDHGVTLGDTWRPAYLNVIVARKS